MKTRPTIFLSGVSHEFGSFRDAVENEIEMKGCFAENQPGFPPDYRTVEDMLRKKLHESDAVIHIVGFRFGAEPNLRPLGVARRSYTQMEFDIAREMGKPVYVFVSSAATVRDPLKRDEKTGADIPDPPQDAEATAIQLAHRDAVQKTNHLYYFFNNAAELSKLVAEIPEVKASGFQADISRIIKYAPAELLGREAETKLLADTWAACLQVSPSPRLHVLIVVALGGEGKTSLVAKWAADLAAQDWPGCDAVFAWSFYSQGTREQTAVSSDLFLAEALTFFGDAAMAGSAQGAFEKGKRLAHLVGERRALLILDGLEPLQYAPTSPTPGELKDQGLSALLKGLAANSHGLCVVTTRYALPDLRAFHGRTVREEKLARLARAAGVQLLKAHGVTGSDRRNLPLHDGDAKSELVSEFEKLVEDVDGHALTLHILGSFLKKAFGGDIRKRDRVTFAKASQKTDNDHAFRAMAAYARWMEDGSDEARRELAILRLMGLFDRPATADCLAALLAAPAIPGLTEPLTGLNESQWRAAYGRLEETKLLSIRRDALGVIVSVHAHPHVSEYFGFQLRTKVPASWRAAHRRLYEYLCASTQEGDQLTVEALQPLCQAVAHGCQAGLEQETFGNVYLARIARGNNAYVTRRLGAFGLEWRALACFFETPWSRVSPALTETAQALLLNEAGFCLRALGRLTEALEPMRTGLRMGVEQEDWVNSAIRAANLSELGLALGEVAVALEDAEQSVAFADRSGDATRIKTSRATHANVLHQAGRWAEAEVRFREAEQIQAESQPAYPLLYSSPGFEYCELLLAHSERRAWQLTLEGRPGEEDRKQPKLEAAWRAAYERACQVRGWLRDANGTSLIDDALSELAVGRAVLHEAVFKGVSFAQTHPSIERALSILRRAGQQQYIAHGLLTRSWLRFCDGSRTGPESAQSDLDEAWEVAERGPMPLVMADIHLHRARLFGLSEWESSGKTEWTAYPWQSPEHDLAEARRLIVKHGYLRRMEELEAAEAWMHTPSNLRQANKLEATARQLMSVGDLNAAWAKLMGAVAADESRKSRIKQEFEFAFSFEGELDASRPSVKQDSEALNWRRQVWSVLAKGSGVQIEHALALLTADSPIAIGTLKSELGQASAGALGGSATPQEKGKLLEEAVSRLFNTFFKMGGETPWKNRQQTPGTQDGYDISLEWSGEFDAHFDQRVRVHIECKNYTKPITHNEVGGKLIVEGLASPAVIDHWILISPCADIDPNNPLNRFLESEHKNPRFDFSIQVWSPETGVREFFGLEPEVFDQFYESEDGEPHPRTWDETKRSAVRKKWMARLARPLRLPVGWTEYIRDPAKLCTRAEDSTKFLETDANHVTMRCLNSAGALLEKPLKDYVEDWLRQTNKPSLFLLGEFGDGKTFFTYVLARQLVEAWLKNREAGWLPLRFTLKKYPGNAAQFLEQRLKEFRADMAGWIEMERHSQKLVILDGFDEMSVKVGPAAVTKNIGDLLACADEFKGCKILITSRTHFFENRKDAQRLLSRLGDPEVYQLAPIGRKEALQNLQNHLDRLFGAEQARERLSRIHQMNDPIGLACKPLFLHMLKVVLSGPEIPEDLNVHKLYEGYIQDSLEQNERRLDDGDNQAAKPTEIIPNMRGILGELAEELQRSKQAYVSLRRFKAKSGKPIAELLWRLSGGEEMETDAQTRVGARSLLTRVSDEAEDGEWLVDFCHRSMKEYFVGIRLCEAVEAGLEAGQTFLKEVPMNHEILQFAAERWREIGSTSLASDRLLQLISQSGPGNFPGLSGGYAISLLCRLNPDLPRHFDWKNKVFDGADLEDADLSGLDFSDSSFVEANLANVNFERSIFERCDLTGVRLEETKSVVSLAAKPSGDEIIALYGDGALREWQVKSGSKMSSTVVGSVKVDAGTVIGIHESGQAWAHRPREWSFFCQSAKPWGTEGVFPIREDFGCIHSKSGRLAFTSRIDEDRVKLSVVDLESQEIVGIKEVNRAQWCAALGAEAFVWSDAAVGLRIGRANAISSSDDIVLAMPLEPTCLDVWRCDSREHLVTAGVGDGRIFAWKIVLKAVGWSSDKLLESQAHQGAVTTIAFTGESRVASGGSDKTIVLTRLIGPENLAGAQERRLQRSLRCRKMRIEGVKGPAEFEMLQRFVAQCEEESS